MDPVANVLEGRKDVTFKGPPGTDIGDLPVAVVGEFKISRWRPDAHERELIAQGGDVYLLIEGNAQPPVMVTAETPRVSTQTVEQEVVGFGPSPVRRDRDDRPAQPFRRNG